MSVTIKNLGAGSLPNGTTAVTPGPLAGKAWIVKSIILTNRDSVARSVEVKVTSGTALPGGGGTTGWIAPQSMVLAPATSVVLDNEITLQYPSALSINCTTTPPATTIDVVINGLERDV